MQLPARTTNFERKPSIRYSGLTIVVSHPSRFDTASLFSGYAGSYFLEALSPIPYQACDIRLANNNTTFIPETKVVLLLGREAVARYIPNDHSLNEQRGCPYFSPDGLTYIPTYSYQDAMDMKDYESKYNSSHTEGIDEDDSPDYGDPSDKSTHGRTSRDNFKFWMTKDIEKAKRLLRDPSSRITPQINYDIFPPLEQLRIEGTTIYLDIETDSRLNISCIGFTTDKQWPTVTVVPFMRYTQAFAYDERLLALFLRRLAVAMLTSTVVVHNSMFDLFVLSWRYGLPFGKSIYDTMLAHSRLAPGVEKSLGHCVSLYTDMPYHKSEGVFEPKTEAQERSLWQYNGKDVAVMPLIRQGIDLEAGRMKAVDSVKQINDSVYPYLLMTLLGMRYDKDELDKIVATNERWINQLLRISKVLVGYDFLPSSSKQCVKYFHDQLKFPKVATSKKTGAASLNEKAMWKLALKHNDHPMIPITVEYRRLLKQSGALKFNHWNINELCPP